MPSSTTPPTNGSMSPPLPDGPVPPPMPLSPDGLFCSHQEGGLALVGVIPLKETSLRIHGNGSFFLGMWISCSIAESMAPVRWNGDDEKQVFLAGEITETLSFQSTLPVFGMMSKS
jgi:hypothetical protein